jgi:hypothetical protein
MNFDRIAGFASAGCILLILTLNGWLGLWGPIWKAAWKMQPGDALAVIVAIIGWAVTIMLGGGAILFSQRQISLAREQLRLQQGQIEEAHAEQRRAKYSGLDAEFNELTRGIDRLRTATAYLKNFAALFPTGRLDGWSLALYYVRMNADDNVSASAITAPFGYGERVSTVMNRIQRLGDRLTQASPDSMPTQGMQMQFEQRIKGTIEGMLLLAHQIDAELPARYAQLDALRNQRDIFRD